MKIEFTIEDLKDSMLLTKIDKSTLIDNSIYMLDNPTNYILFFDSDKLEKMSLSFKAIYWILCRVEGDSYVEGLKKDRDNTIKIREVAIALRNLVICLLILNKKNAN
jgi:hypothetical protein